MNSILSFQLHFTPNWLSPLSFTYSVDDDEDESDHYERILPLKNEKDNTNPSVDKAESNGKKKMSAMTLDKFKKPSKLYLLIGLQSYLPCI